MDRKSNEHRRGVHFCDWISPDLAGIAHFGRIDTSDLENIHLSITRRTSAIGFGDSIPVLVGHMGSIPFITIQEVLLSERTKTLNEMVVEIYRPARVYFGDNTPDAVDLQFESAVFELSHLPEWYAHNAIDFEFGDGGGMAFCYTPPTPDLVRYHGKEIEMRFCPYPAIGHHHVKFHVEVSVEVRNGEKISFDQWHRRYFHPIRCFFMFLQNGYVDRGRTYFYSHRESKTERRDVAFTDVLERQYSGREPRNEETPNFRMLAPYGACQDRLGGMLVRWLDLYSAAQDGINTFMSLYLKQDMFVEQQFLALAQSAEAIHRSMDPNSRTVTDEHRRRMGEVVGACPKHHQKWLKEKLAFSHEPTLRIRLNEMLVQARCVMEPLVGDLDRFAKSVVDTRNNLVHGSTKRKTRRAASADEIIDSVEYLGYLMRFNLLLAISDDEHWSADRLTNLEGYKWSLRRETPPAAE